MACASSASGARCDLKSEHRSINNSHATGYVKILLQEA